MIYLNFIFDYLVSIFLPFKTYFTINNLDQNNLPSVIIIALIMDLLYQKPLLNLIIILILYFLLKLLKIKQKYHLVKNIILYLIYFNITNFIYNINITTYLSLFIPSLILQLLYILYSKWLLK